MNKLGNLYKGTARFIFDQILNKKTEGRNLYFDFEHHRLVDYDTGELLKDYSGCEDPSQAMAADFVNGFKAPKDEERGN